jgi:hypothetical protein
MLGTMMKFIGRTTLNEMFGKLEFVANVVLSDVNPEEEIKNLKENKEESKHKEKAEIKEEKTKKETKPEPKPEKKTEKSEPENDDDDLLSLEDIEEIDEEDI